mmetsp:Transcript_27166/g.59371  ORF Transcript_27166/g.59371 Transcript_27166/m.59371 type:complete len:218 (-) Transcript_27166:574-1227(-)
MSTCRFGGCCSAAVALVCVLLYIELAGGCDEGRGEGATSRQVLASRDRRASPHQLLCGEVLVDEAHVVPLQLRNVLQCVALRVQVVLIERLEPGQVLLVILIQQVVVGVVAMQRVERVVPHDGVRRPRQQTPVLHHHLIHVLVVPPAHVHVLEAAVLSVHPELGVVLWVVLVGVALEEAVVDDGLVVRAAHGEGVTYTSPLSQRAEGFVRHHLSEIM